ncbi:MAG: reactive intermediate/imine deaminase [Clostridia bacterium]|nr:reactive intermediate/imine deaminase [Clostridia bacterium]MBQ4086513.1 reactive intermediate/imine deaminase [Clostridia bacterium]
MKKTFFTQVGPKAIGPYCTAIITEDTVYMSGMLGIDPAIGKLAEGGVEAEAKQSLANIKAVLAEMGLTPANVVKTTVFLADLGDFACVNALYADVFGPDYPARSCVQVAALPSGARVEIECIAVKEI